MTVALEEVCTITMGQAPSGASYNVNGDGFALIAGAGDFSTGTLAPKKFTTQPTKVSAPGDIILSIRASIGAKVWADAEYCLGRGVASLRPSENLDRRYLWHWLSHAESALTAKGRGATFLQVNRTDIGELPIELPPLDEQRRIADILDHADALRAKRRQVLAHLDSLTQSIFHDMFGDPVRNDRGLPTSTLGSVAKVVTGSSPTRSDPANFGDAIEWIKSDNLGGHIATTAAEWLSEHGRQRARIAPVDSVLVTCIAGSRTSIGKVSAVDRPVAFNQQINAIFPSETLDPAFLLAQFQVAPELVRAKSTGGMKGLVNKSAFQAIEIVVPTPTAQHRFSAIFAKVRHRRNQVERILAADDELFTSLQSRAFRGEL